MDDPLTISLVVTGIGMLMLFLALAVLYGLMVLMTRMTDIRGLIKERPEAETGEQESREAGSRKQEASSGEQEAKNGKRRAAVIGVALACAERELSEVGAPGAEEAASSWRVSPWRALHHQRQLTPSLRTRRGR
jgi:Na+-transporting methylmalonyl-CoA/oxaloacetate decarboxylase gamma subunit